MNLNLLTPEATGKKWAEYLGDASAVLAKARKDYEKGEYQWVAQVTKELVFADPSNQEARNLCADALEQLGYLAESGIWRNAYLTAALELRCGNQAIHAPKAALRQPGDTRAESRSRRYESRHDGRDDA